jgi:hypothetical protein
MLRKACPKITHFCCDFSENLKSRTVIKQARRHNFQEVYVRSTSTHAFIRGENKKAEE